MTDSLLELRDLSIEFSAPQGSVPALSAVSLTIGHGEKLAIVGESGSGKTTAMMAVVGLLPPSGRIAAGRILLDGEDVTKAPERRLRNVRGGLVSIVFQNARAALNPVRRIGDQIADAILAHRRMTRRNALASAIELLEAVRFRDPAKDVDAFPHQLSGGMCQRAMLAMAIACEPRLLIADEPTTGLDVTVQKSVMTLLDQVVRERGMSLILITHDLSLAANYCDRIAVMRNGSVVEQGKTSDIVGKPSTPYTKALLETAPRMSTAKPAPAIARKPLLQVGNLVKSYPARTAVDGVSFVVGENESVGLVGESGSGKSTVARLIARLVDPTAGSIIFDGEEIGNVAARRFHRSPLRPDIQLIFQDATDSLAPHMTAFASIADPIRRLKTVKDKDLRERVASLADRVGFSRSLLDRLPHQLSGGQKARVGIARAIAVEPRLLILDEPTASLDVSVQAVILELLAELRRDLAMSYLFISHDLNVVSNICDRTIVLHRGVIVEEGDSAIIFSNPSRPYTRELLDAVLRLPQPEQDSPVRLAK